MERNCLAKRIERFFPSPSSVGAGKVVVGGRIVKDDWNELYVVSA